MKMTDNIIRRGDKGQAIAEQYLWDHGYEVFPNKGTTGPVDIMAWNMETDQILKIDVKSAWDAFHSSVARSPAQKELGVIILHVNIKAKACRFVNHHDTKGFLP